MHILLAAVGKSKASSHEVAIAELTKRIPWKITLKTVEEKRDLPPEQLKAREAELLLKIIPPTATVIVLDERGKNLSSQAFADQITKWESQGKTELAFVIGGAYGHGEAMKARADMLLSLGEMTWPHMMVRLMLTEQLYRAYTLKINHPYHKS